MKNYTMVIGLEIHCELGTRSKIFCSCPTEFGAEENAHVCERCMGMPGTLPVLNKKVVEYAVKAGLSLNCNIQNYSKLDRKNYFYPDLPKAYQISQYDEPICLGGYLDITKEDGEKKRINITRIHIEEDAGKLIHEDYQTLLDNNRCGVPLIEIVTEPEIRSAEEALLFAETVRNNLLTVGVSDCKMQEGSLRFDVNLSVMPEGSSEFGTRTEMKNLNSFRSLKRAIEYEYKRQVRAVEKGEEIVQETRKWDDEKGKSFSMRSKEDAHDYRYFPDPDLVPIILTDEEIAEYKAQMPELPQAKKERFMEEYSLSEYDANFLAGSSEISDFFEEAIKDTKNIKSVANFLMGDISAYLNSNELEFADIKFTPANLAKLINLVDKGDINLSTAKKVLNEMFASGDDAEKIVEEKGLKQMNDTGEIKSIVEKILNDNPQVVEDLKGGKKKAGGFVVGQVMRQTKGKANPAIVNQLINEILGL